MSESAMSKELAAMVQVEQALSGLSVDEQTRVITWAASRFEVATIEGRPQPARRGGREEHPEAGQPSTDPHELGSLAEFYDAARPDSDAEKALVVGYWYQFREGHSELEAQRINSELKHLGHGVGNITRALDWHKAQKPALMIQKRKEGTTKQARKKFVVTNEGKKFVEKMVASA